MKPNQNNNNNSMDAEIKKMNEEISSCNEQGKGNTHKKKKKTNDRDGGRREGDGKEKVGDGGRKKRGDETDKTKCGLDCDKGDKSEKGDKFKKGDRSEDEIINNISDLMAVPPKRARKDKYEDEIINNILEHVLRGGKIEDANLIDRMVMAELTPEEREELQEIFSKMPTIDPNDTNTLRKLLEERDRLKSVGDEEGLFVIENILLKKLNTETENRDVFRHLDTFVDYLSVEYTTFSKSNANALSRGVIEPEEEEDYEGEIFIVIDTSGSHFNEDAFDVFCNFLAKFNKKIESDSVTYHIVFVDAEIGAVLSISSNVLNALLEKKDINKIIFREVSKRRINNGNTKIHAPLYSAYNTQLFQISNYYNINRIISYNFDMKNYHVGNKTMRFSDIKFIIIYTNGHLNPEDEQKIIELARNAGKKIKRFWVYPVGKDLGNGYNKDFFDKLKNTGMDEFFSISI